MFTPDPVTSAVEPEVSEKAEAWHVKPSAVLSIAELAELNVKCDRKGWQQLITHLSVMAISGAIWGWSLNENLWWLAIPAVIVYGFSLASMFAPVHECVHRTAFANQRVNDVVAWLAGILSFYNSTFYRRYHKWHHRYTRVLDKDPEYEDLPPTNWGAYLWILSGISWWMGKVQNHWRMATGNFAGCPYISEAAKSEVMRSTRWQLVVYGVAIALSLAFQQPWFIFYWLLPLAVGQPILRFILLAEHTGCTQDNNPLTNTRTTLTLWPLRRLMWNMPFHAEHHLYASIPFHALPQAHAKLAGKFTYVVPGYITINRQIVGEFRERETMLNR